MTISLPPYLNDLVEQKHSIGCGGSGTTGVDSWHLHVNINFEGTFSNDPTAPGPDPADLQAVIDAIETMFTNMAGYSSGVSDHGWAVPGSEFL